MHETTIAVSDLRVGGRYVFAVREWVEESGRVIPGKRIVRTMLPPPGVSGPYDDLRLQGPECFLQVRSPEGRVHRLHSSAIESFEILSL